MPRYCEKTALTDKSIKAKKPVRGKQTEYPDALVPGLRLLVTSAGAKRFILVGRFPGQPKHSTRRSLGDYLPPEAVATSDASSTATTAVAPHAVTLEQAREKARSWLQLVARGVDPRTEIEREKANNRQLAASTFGIVATDFLERYAVNLAKSAEAKRIINREFVKRWRDRPAAEIMPRDAATAIRAIKDRGAPYEAHNAFGHLRRLFNWAIASGEYGLTSSPMERLSPNDVIGARREARDRVLSDFELACVWHASEKMGYPYTALTRLLILTGQRLNEVAGMSWSEVDLIEKVWTIPAARMKGDRAHVVPLADEALAIVGALAERRRKPPKPVPKVKGQKKIKETLPLWDKGEFVFSTSRGARPVSGFSKTKTRLDGYVADVRAKAADDDGVPISTMPRWTFHDLRRTARTHFSALPVQDLVRELVIAHAKPGLHKVYDQHVYLAEKRECLLLWEKRLLGIITPKPKGDVVDLAVARAARAEAG